jgi:uncharacterized iron-regulated membrane protein
MYRSAWGWANKMRVRAGLHWLHKWGGVAVGVVVALIGLSGSLLVFRADIERWQVRQWLEVAPSGERLDLDAIVAIGAAAIPAKEVVRVMLPAAPTQSVEVVLQKRRPRNLKDAELVSVFVDPYRGVVLGQRERATGWIWQLQDFHYALFAGEPGLKANGLVALTLLLLAISGPVLWWPGWRRRADAFRVRARPRLAFWRDLHAIAGVAACVVLAFLAVTALYFAYRPVATAVVTLTTGSGGVAAPQVTPTTAAEAPRATLAALLASATAAVPAARWDELRPARRPGSAAVISFREPGDFVLGRHRLYLDPSNAAIIRIDRHDQLPPGARVLGNMVPWHFGTFGGRFTQWLWFLAGLMPAALFASGLWLWWSRRRRVAA